MASAATDFPSTLFNASLCAALSHAFHEILMVPHVATVVKLAQPSFKHGTLVGLHGFSCSPPAAVQVPLTLLLESRHCTEFGTHP